MASLEDDIKARIRFNRRRVTSLEKKLDDIVMHPTVKRYIAMRLLHDHYVTESRDLTVILGNSTLDEDEK